MRQPIHKDNVIAHSNVQSKGLNYPMKYYELLGRVL